MIDSAVLWSAIHKSLSPWDLNVLTLTRFSHVCKAAREVFTSDLVWEPLNVYNVSDVWQHFYKMVESMPLAEKQRMQLVWSLARTNSHRATGQLLMSLLANGTLAPEYENRYMTLGFIVATAFMPLRQDVKINYTVSDRRLLHCALQINPLCIARIHPSLHDDMALYKEAYRTPLCRCDLGDISFEELINDFFAKIFRLLPNNIRYNQEILHSTLQRDPSALSALPSRYRHNVGLILYALSFHGTSFQDLPTELRENRDFLIRAIVLHKRVLLTLPNELLQDREFLLAAFAKCHADELDGERIVAAIEKAWQGSTLNEDFEVMLSLVKWCGLAIRIAGAELQNDVGLREAALEQNGLALKYFKHCSRSEALTAVKSKGCALEYLESWSSDPEIVAEALKNDSAALKFSGTRIKDDSGMPGPELILAAPQDNPLKRGRHLIRFVI